ncbi:MAG: DUF262 domain-containing protein [Lachnospiraceae bacterium]|nr:DUF262 domain-containing protein [Lachnospiraceae bacterium]
MARPRKQTYTLEMYLKKNMKGDIDNKADVQRNFAWNNEQVNELVVTVLTDDYIPPIILGEEENSKLHIVDGGCRTAALIKFRHMNYKITPSIENSMISYKKKVRDKNGNISYEDTLFNIKNKTYEKLPEELKERFDEYQIETVIHESCDSYKISRYIKRYNNHVAMSTDQKAFTYIDKFANRIRKIVDSKFFVECCECSEKDKTKGVIERIIVETLMCMNHFDNWKTQAKSAFKYLNEHAKEEEFDSFANYLHRLENVITDDIKNIFNKKDSFVFLTLFDKFAKLEMEDSNFAEFLKEFNENMRTNKKNKKGLLFDEIDKDLSTKDKQVITDKLELLENLMLEFLRDKQTDDETFIAENLNIDVETLRNEMDYYTETLNKLEEKTIKLGSKLLEKENRKSLLAMVVYSFREDIDLDDWLAEYAQNTDTYIIDQKQNFLHMKADFEQYYRTHKKSA